MLSWCLSANRCEKKDDTVSSPKRHIAIKYVSEDTHEMSTCREKEMTSRFSY